MQLTRTAKLERVSVFQNAESPHLILFAKPVEAVYWKREFFDEHPY
jgi:hypothetical protein